MRVVVVALKKTIYPKRKIRREEVKHTSHPLFREIVSFFVYAYEVS